MADRQELGETWSAEQLSFVLDQPWNHRVGLAFGALGGFGLALLGGTGFASSLIEPLTALLSEGQALGIALIVGLLSLGVALLPLLLLIPLSRGPVAVEVLPESLVIDGVSFAREELAAMRLVDSRLEVERVDGSVWRSRPVEARDAVRVAELLAGRLLPETVRDEAREARERAHRELAGVQRRAEER